MNVSRTRTIAVIPARGNSKGIPRKNARLLAGRPLLAYSIQNALSCPLISAVVVSTEDDELANIATEEGALVIQRTPRLSGDDVTLDPVVHDAVVQAERSLGETFDCVVTLQPTSPLLTPATLRSAIEAFMASDKDSLISAVNRPRLSWSATEDGFSPDYPERVNRQWLPPHLVETGAFVVSKRAAITPASRLGEATTVFEMPGDEAVDIDETSDWLVCESVLRRKRIALRVDGHSALGMGHIYHCLTLAYRLVGHEVHFVTSRHHRQGVEVLLASNFPVQLVDDEAGFYEFLRGEEFDIVVVDCLDTSAEYVRRLKSIVSRVVTIEDLGDGAREADAVINALYEGAPESPNHFVGDRFVCLRDEFLGRRKNPFRDVVSSVVVLFGGTDPSNLTTRVYDIARRLKPSFPSIRFDFVLGPGYDSLNCQIESREEDLIFVHRSLKRVSSVMRFADLAITSQGRTVYELASLGVPAIVLAQNEREQLHTFAQMQNGFVNLGLGTSVSDESIERTFTWLVETSQVRRELRDLMSRYDLASGVDRVATIVLGEFVGKNGL